MDVDEFWHIVEQARADAGMVEGQFNGRAMLRALTERLVSLPADEIMEFGDRFSEQLGRIPNSPLMWAACVLLTRQLSDDTFDYFRWGIIALGRDAFERFIADPDSLADDPVVAEIAAGRLRRSVLVAEEVGWAAVEAYARLNGGDEDAYWDALAARPHPGRAASRPQTESDAPEDPIVSVVDLRELGAVRLPRLTALLGGL